MNDTFGLAQMQSDLITDEGERLRPYVDTTGNITVGVGRNLSVNGISSAEATILLLNDIATAAANLDAGMPWWRTLPEPQQRVMANLMFNLGPVRFAEFTTFLGFMKEQKFPSAAADLATTLWFKQVGARGPRMLQRLGVVSS